MRIKCEDALVSITVLDAAGAAMVDALVTDIGNFLMLVGNALAIPGFNVVR